MQIESMAVHVSALPTMLKRVLWNELIVSTVSADGSVVHEQLPLDGVPAHRPAAPVQIVSAWTPDPARGEWAISRAVNVLRADHVSGVWSDGFEHAIMTLNGLGMVSPNQTSDLAIALAFAD